MEVVTPSGYYICTVHDDVSNDSGVPLRCESADHEPCRFVPLLIPATDREET